MISSEPSAMDNWHNGNVHKSYQSTAICAGDKTYQPTVIRIGHKMISTVLSVLDSGQDQHSTICTLNKTICYLLNVTCSVLFCIDLGTDAATSFRRPWPVCHHRYFVIAFIRPRGRGRRKSFLSTKKMPAT